MLVITTPMRVVTMAVVCIQDAQNLRPATITQWQVAAITVVSLMRDAPIIMLAITTRWHTVAMALVNTPVVLILWRVIIIQMPLVMMAAAHLFLDV